MAAVVVMVKTQALGHERSFGSLSFLSSSPGPAACRRRLASSVPTVDLRYNNCDFAVHKHVSINCSSGTLLPPLPLYRRILRSHRNLPREMRSLGDDYVKAEFRRHREVTNKVHIIGFLSQWKVYLDELPAGPEGQSFRGKPLDPTKLEKMSAEQLGQLYEVMHVTKNVWKPVTPEQDGKGNGSSQS